MIGNSVAASVVTTGAPKVSKEPDFLGPDELPMLPEYLVNQDPTEADKYHIKMKEWWESVHENLQRMRDMIVSYQVAEAKESAGSDLSKATALLSQQSITLVGDLDVALQDIINTHAGRTDNPHSVTKSQVGLGNVENTAISTYTVPSSQTSGFHAVATSGSYNDLNNQPTTLSLLSNISTATGEAGTNVSYNSTTGVFTIPKGDKGDKGDQGDPADLPVADSSTLGGVKEGGDIDIDENGLMTINASASVQGPGWNYLSNQPTIYNPPKLYGTYSDIDLHIFGANGVPANARYAMIGHQHNQGYCQVYVGGRATVGDTKWVMFGSQGDNHNGRSIIVVENMALPKLHYDEVYNGSSSVTYPNSDSHANIIQEGRVRFNFGTHDNDGSGTTHTVKLIAWSY